MIIKTKQTWKDLVEGPNHKSLTRRDLLRRGLATGVMGVAIPKFIFGDFVKEAMAGTLTCPPPTANLGAIAQLFASGGPTMGARFISEAQAGIMNSTIAANYGISGQANLLKLGSNMVIDVTSPFGATLMMGPPGYPGGAPQWQSKVLRKISGGGHLGPFNADDGAGQDTGLIGGMSPFKQSKMAKDIKIGIGNKLATWANGLPSSSVGGNVTPTSLAKVYSMTPASAGLINAPAMTAASNAASSLAQSLSTVFNNANRQGSDQMLTSAGCAFYGNSALVDPSYGLSLFNPTNIAPLATNVTLSSLSTLEQAHLAAYYQSAVGTLGGVVTEFGGRDYHGQDVTNTIAPADVEDARAIVMFLAACDAAQAPGSFIYLANGQAVANGTQSVTATTNNNTTSFTVNGPVAQGDAGGSYNAGLIIFYDPKGSPPAAVFTGTVNSNNGNAQISSTVGSSAQAVAGLYLSALSWITGGTIPASALTAMQAAGVAGTPSNIMVI